MCLCKQTHQLFVPDSMSKPVPLQLCRVPCAERLWLARLC
jgi:hypothetical protein